jgi:PhoH-like ATPase
MPLEFSTEKVDNLILATAYMCKTKEKGKYSQVTLITQDVNLRLKCDALGVHSEGYQNSKVTTEEQGIYDGTSDLVLTPEQYHKLCKRTATAGTLLPQEHGYFPQQFLRIKMEDSPETLEYVRYISDKVPFHRVTVDNTSKPTTAYKIKPKNIEQELALSLLLDPTVDLVTLTGHAGSGKTLLAIAAAFELTLDKHRYDRILITRSAVPMGRDIGFLPGDLKEKMAPWLAPVFDNVQFILHGNKSLKEREKERSEKFFSPNQEIDIEYLMNTQVLTVEALTYIRGRSIPQTLMLLDEVQNLSVHELKTVITRMGVGSKLILTGDLDQIDNPHVDRYSNGLTYAIERFKECPFAGHVNLVRGERSQLATYAAKVL